MSRILVADDVEANRYLLTAIFKGAGHEVVAAENGALALELALKAPPDLIVSDILMPVMDGFDLCRRWKSDERLKATPFVFYTATYTSPEDERFALSLGAERFVIKPQKPEVLMKLVGEVLEEARQRQPRAMPTTPAEDAEVLRRHKDALFRKLERKVLQLEAEIAGRERAQAALRDSLEALRLSEERFRALIEKSTDMLLVLDAEGSIRFWSPSATEALGWAREDVMGRSVFELVHPDDRDRVEEAYLASRPGHATPRAPMRCRHKDGSLRHVEASARNLLNDAAVQGIVVNGRDVTEQRLLEEQLRQSQKLEAVGRLAGGIAHDFNNLLAIINSYSELALQSLEDDDPLHPDLRQILAAGQKAAGLTRQILAFSRKQMLQPVVLDLNAVVRDLEKMLRRVVGEDVDLRISLAKELGRVRADPGQIEQVLMNLVVNARDAMPGGGTLTIETADSELDAAYADAHAEVSPGAYVVVNVSDSGCGMDGATLARIFEPFFTTKKPGEGTGLGLSTVYGIVKQSGGHLSVSSEPGKGSIFRVYLPRESAPIEATERAPRVAREVTGNETVMIVEDQEDVRAVVARVLGGLGYRVLVAGDGSEALRLAEEQDGRIDLLLTDVVLPQTSGPELARRLLAGHPEARLLFMSGYANEGIQHAGGLPSGADLITKPFTASGLAQKVREVLGGEPQAVRRYPSAEHHAGAP